MEDFMKRARKIWVLDTIIASIEEKIDETIEEKIPSSFEEEISDELRGKIQSIVDPLYQEFWKAYDAYVKDFIDPEPENNSLPYLIAQAKRSWGIFGGTIIQNSLLLDYKIIRETSGREYRICIYRQEETGIRVVIPVDKDLFDYVKISYGLDCVGCADKRPSKTELSWSSFDEVYTLHPAQRVWVGKARKKYWVAQSKDEYCTCEG